jgi:hypothetical protein
MEWKLYGSSYMHYYSVILFQYFHIHTNFFPYGLQ